MSLSLKSFIDEIFLAVLPERRLAAQEFRKFISEYFSRDNVNTNFTVRRNLKSYGIVKFSCLFYFYIKLYKKKL